jgi:hypothetical protein
MSTYTQTATRTITDVQQTFRSFKADLGMIAMRTGKWTQDKVDLYFHDILKLAEQSYLERVDIILHDSYTSQAIRVATFTINNDGTTPQGSRAGGNDWPNQANTHLSLLIHYSAEWWKRLPDERTAFASKLKGQWTTSTIDSNYPHLTREQAQLYATNGYELQKQNLK